MIQNYAFSHVSEAQVRWDCEVQSMAQWPASMPGYRPGGPKRMSRLQIESREACCTLYVRDFQDCKFCVQSDQLSVACAKGAMLFLNGRLIQLLKRELELELVISVLLGWFSRFSMIRSADAELFCELRGGRPTP